MEAANPEKEIQRTNEINMQNITYQCLDDFEKADRAVHEYYKKYITSHYCEKAKPTEQQKQQKTDVFIKTMGAAVTDVFKHYLQHEIDKMGSSDLLSIDKAASCPLQGHN